MTNQWDFTVTTAESVEKELRALWRLVPVSTDAFRRHAPMTCLFLSAADAPDQALAALGMLLREYEDDPEIGAAAAAFGMDSLLRGKVTEKNVDERFFDFALAHGRNEGRTARRWAERGTKKIAAIVARYWESRPQLRLVASNENDEFNISLSYDRNWSDHRILAFDLYIGDTNRLGWGEHMPDDLHRIEEPEDTFEQSWAGVRPGQNGSLYVVIQWLCAVTPEVWCSIDSPLTSGFAMTPGRALLTLSPQVVRG